LVGILSALEFLLTDEDTTFWLACLQLFHTPKSHPDIFKEEISADVHPGSD
jgi:hypothetical protein